jgi:hypothetical protein
MPSKKLLSVFSGVSKSACASSHTTPIRSAHTWGKSCGRSEMRVVAVAGLEAVPSVRPRGRPRRGLGWTLAGTRRRPAPAFRRLSGPGTLQPRTPSIASAEGPDSEIHATEAVALVGPMTPEFASAAPPERAARRAPQRTGTKLREAGRDPLATFLVVVGRAPQIERVGSRRVLSAQNHRISPPGATPFRRTKATREHDQEGAKGLAA